MKNMRRFLTVLSITFIGILLLSACKSTNRVDDTGDHTDSQLLSDPVTDLLPEPSTSPIASSPVESEPPSVETSPLVKIVDSGVCGENATWTLNEEGTLTVSGSGAIYGYMGYHTDSDATCEDPSQLTPPWNEHYDNQSIKTVVIGPGITCIGVGAFMMCPELTNVSISDNVTVLASSAFADCPNLKFIELPSGVIELGKFVFCGCVSLNTFSLPDTIQRVDSFAFGECSSLSVLNIAGVAVEIDQQAFFGCVGLTSINYGGTKQQWSDSKLDTVDFGSKDYTLQFCDGNSFHYVYQEPLTQDAAQIIAYQYWGVDPDEAAKFGSDINPDVDNEIFEWNGNTYFSFKQYGVGTATYVWASQNENITRIFIDAITGEVFTQLT